MKHLFVSYEIAKQLKEKGFDEPCLVWHLWDGTELNKEFKDKVSQPLYSPKTNTEFQETKHIGAPLYQQVIDWFREKHNITVSVIGYYYPHLGKHFYLTRVNEKENGENWGYIESYYEALNKAIEEALKLV